MKKIISWIKDLKGWQKLIFGILLIGIIAFVIGLLVLLVFKISSSIEKAKLEDYLTEVGYSCQDIYCTRIEGDKTEEVRIESDFYSPKAWVVYSVEVKDNYSVSIYRYIYEKYGNKSDRGNIIFASNLNPSHIETLVAYIPEDFYKENFDGELNNNTVGAIVDKFVESGACWHEGDKAVLISESATDLSSYVNEALREFENYFDEAEIEIK